MLVIRKAAVLGAGRMGTAVAAHLANAGIPTLLLDLAPTELTEEEQKKGLDLTHPSVRNRLATNGIATAAKGRPAAFAHPSRVDLLTPGNFEDDLPKLADVDWVIEAVVERLDVKSRPAGPGGRVSGPQDHLSTNSSGLSVNAMAAALPDEVKPRFLGSHFFFPPRYMYLLELIPGEETDPAVVEGLKEFAELRLGKGVVLSEDTPNFVANRIGIFSTVYAINAMDKYGLTIEEVDAASGRALARSVTATFGTSNLAGTDVLAYAVASHYETAVDDEMREQWRLPEWILEMVKRGYLGEKSGGSFFREKRTLVIDPATLEYRPWQDPRQPSLAEANKHLRPGGPGQDTHRGGRRRGPVRVGPAGGDLHLLGQPHPRDHGEHRWARPGHAVGLRLGARSVRAVGRPRGQRDGGADAGRRARGSRMGAGTGGLGLAHVLQREGDRVLGLGAGSDRAQAPRVPCPDHLARGPQGVRQDSGRG